MGKAEPGNRRRRIAGAGGLQDTIAGRAFATCSSVTEAIVLPATATQIQTTIGTVAVSISALSSPVWGSQPPPLPPSFRLAATCSSASIHPALQSFTCRRARIGACLQTSTRCGDGGTGDFGPCLENFREHSVQLVLY